MEPGEGGGQFADDFADSIAGPVGGAVAGTASHVAWFDGGHDRGPAHVVTFVPDRDVTEDDFCVWIASGMGCRVVEGEPQVHGYGWDATYVHASAFGGSNGAEAVFTTEFGKTISVLTVDGYAYAEWSADWGKPAHVTFYDTSGSNAVFMNLPQDD